MMGRVTGQVMKLLTGCLALASVSVSCVYDYYEDIPPDDGTPATVEITIRTGAPAGTRDGDDGYDVGSEWDNYIDVEGGDYRIYFFTASAAGGNDTFIAGFTTLGVEADSSSGHTDYTLVGRVDADMSRYPDFKIMVLANWGTYDDDAMTTSTTIDELCNASWAQFDALDSNGFMVDSEHLIPFYGIHKYSDYTFEKGEKTDLDGPVTLLRAMAKVEVIMKSTDYRFSDVSIYGYNSRGFCAPAGVYSQDDYGPGLDWDSDYLVHLVGGANDTSHATVGHSLTKLEDDTDYETWVGYLPEYSNKTDSDDYAYIAATVDGVTECIYFAEYSNGRTYNEYSSGRYDIQRNCVYTFDVTKTLGGEQP